jgi:hypothetical protein
LEHRSTKRHRTRLIAALPSEHAEAFVSFVGKATTWLTVATGGFLLAVQETYGVAERLRLELGYFWLAVVALSVVSLASTAYKIAQSEKAVASAGS